MAGTNQIARSPLMRETSVAPNAHHTRSIARFVGERGHDVASAAVAAAAASTSIAKHTT